MNSRVEWGEWYGWTYLRDFSDWYMLQNFKKWRHMAFECKLVGKCKSALEISKIEMVQAEDWLLKMKKDIV